MLNGFDRRNSGAINEAERELRVELAACYRAMVLLGMTDLVWTHISARVPGPKDHFLINKFGLSFDEVTASNLVKCDLNGNIVDGKANEVNPAGFTIHSAIHASRPDAKCVIHTHTKAGIAVSCLKRGLLPLSQMALQFYKRIAYHPYEGVALDLSERARLIEDLGPTVKAMVLRNHGLLTLGETIPEAFQQMFYLNRACEIQLAVLSAGEEIVELSEAVCEHTACQFEAAADGGGRGDLEFKALRRLLDRTTPDYKSC
jgi:ribulose-5-phosphate 4-epimerase/fuculose-1-phosphate aldolase